MNTLIKPLLTGVLCYLLREANGHMEICLAEKAATEKAVKRGLAGKLMGYGGDREDDRESYENAALREVLEESGVVARARGLRKFAEIDFDRPEWVYRCHHLFVRDFSGEPRSSREMLSPRWFSIREIPFHLVDESDVRLLPFAISGKLIKGTIYYDAFGKVSRDPDLRLVTSL